MSLVTRALYERSYCTHFFWDFDQAQRVAKALREKGATGLKIAFSDKTGLTIVRAKVSFSCFCDTCNSIIAEDGA